MVFTTGVDFRGRDQARLDWRNVDTVLLWGITVQASLKVSFFGHSIVMDILSSFGGSTYRPPLR